MLNNKEMRLQYIRKIPLNILANLNYKFIFALLSFFFIVDGDTKHLLSLIFLKLNKLNQELLEIAINIRILKKVYTQNP